MTMQNILHNIARVMFFGALSVIALAFAEGLAQLSGASLVAGMYSPGRLLELAATLLVFVIAQLLMQIRDELRSR